MMTRIERNHPSTVRQFVWSLFICLIGFLCLSISPSIGQAADDLSKQLQVPDGFEVSVFATEAQANNIFSMTFDTQGRLLVSGPGYIRALVDKDQNGVAEEVIEYAKLPKGAQGLCAEGDYLYCVSGKGLLRFVDKNQDGIADGEPQGVLQIKTGGEHDAHAIRKGPDGWWYLLAGNSAGVTHKYASLPTSPFNAQRKPSAGALLRIHPQLRGAEIIADGFRNAYDFDFNADGEIFVYDSDGERDITFPWYRPTRLYHVVPGSHAGWESKTWKHPSTYVSMPQEVASFGRGSPTGVVCYRHHSFPAEYQNALFVLDWTYGRVHAVHTTANGSSYNGEPELFMSAKGNFGFAPTDTEVGPDGALYITIGGRGTRGTVFRVTYTGQSNKTNNKIGKSNRLLACLNADQPLSGWSRRTNDPLIKELGRKNFSAVALDQTNRYSTTQRIRAVEILREHFSGLQVAEAQLLQNSTESALRARAIWAMSETAATSDVLALFDKYLLDAEPVVVYQTLQKLNRLQLSLNDLKTLSPLLAKHLGSNDRFVRQAAISVVKAIGPEIIDSLKPFAVQQKRPVVARIQLSLAEVNLKGDLQYHSTAARAGLHVLQSQSLGAESSAIRLEACRLIQKALGDCGPSPHHATIYDGYASHSDLSSHDADLDLLRIGIAEVYPSQDKQLDRELSRLISMLSPSNPDLLNKILEPVTEESHPSDDLHHLIVASRISVQRTISQLEKIGRALVLLEVKVRERKLPQDLYWNDRIKQIYAALVKLDPRLPIAIVQQAEFGLPGHVVYMAEVPGPFFDKAVAAFVKQAQEDENYPWNNDVIFVLSESKTPEIRELIRNRFEEYSTRQAVLMSLSENPLPEEAELFVRGLEVSHLPTLNSAISALEKLSPLNEPQHYVALYQAARRMGTTEKDHPIREKLIRLLQTNTKQEFGFVYGAEGYKPQREVLQSWKTWLTSSYPEHAAALNQKAGAEETEILANLKGVDWSTGNADAGKTIYENRGCAQCHGGSTALGPDLRGVTGRFSKEDLLEAILFPNREVSPRYQATTVVTDEGKLFTGLIIYESIDGMILRDGLNQTHRIETHTIEERTKSNKSLMPISLLKNLTNSEIVDLYSYLQTLQ